VLSEKIVRRGSVAQKVEDDVDRDADGFSDRIAIGIPWNNEARGLDKKDIQ
jgi:hypothetical protein